MKDKWPGGICQPKCVLSRMELADVLLASIACQMIQTKYACVYGLERKGERSMRLSAQLLSRLQEQTGTMMHDGGTRRIWIVETFGFDPNPLNSFLNHAVAPSFRVHSWD